MVDLLALESAQQLVIACALGFGDLCAERHILGALSGMSVDECFLLLA